MSNINNICIIPTGIPDEALTLFAFMRKLMSIKSMYIYICLEDISIETFGWNEFLSKINFYVSVHKPVSVHICPCTSLIGSVHIRGLINTVAWYTTVCKDNLNSVLSPPATAQLFCKRCLFGLSEWSLILGVRSSEATSQWFIQAMTNDFKRQD